MDRNEFPHLNDSQFESVRKMTDIFGMQALQSLVASTPAEQVERVNAFDMYEQGHIAHVRVILQAPAAEGKPPHPKPLRLKRSSQGWAYTREATSPGCFTSWARLCEQLQAAFLPANYEYRKRSRFLSCKQGKRELHEYIQEMRELTASLVGTPLNEHIKATVFIDGLRVGPARTQLFRVQSSTLEEAIQVALQEEYSHRQARTPASAWPGSSSQNPNQASPSAPVPMELGAEQHDIRCFGCGKLGHFKRDCPRKDTADGLIPSPSSRVVGRSQDPGARGTPETSRGGAPYWGRSKSSKGNGAVSVRLADGKAVTVPNIQMDLAVKFEDFDSLEQFTVLDMDP
ncbi:hypothetical protein F442_14352 [Phytophthora nicotianae P10297]|uniref:CCHC-type domain-containing protein n=1 Tax=Phytophthora nicotianae P10297 TaxID=1317064 RepID=W2YT69_PHYNI|nr:hypothetical protein F442_14352 [Phytophthora nicotianae P10297]